MAVHIHPLDIPPKYYKPLGQVVAGWNLTEALIASIIWHIHKIKQPEEGRLFTYRPSAAQKLQIFAVSIKRFVKDASIKDELTLLRGRASDLKAKRNMLAHGLWGRMPTQTIWKVFYHTETDDMLLLKRKEMNVETVRRIAADVRKLNFDLKKFMSRNGVPPP